MSDATRPPSPADEARDKEPLSVVTMGAPATSQACPADVEGGEGGSSRPLTSDDLPAEGWAELNQRSHIIAHLAPLPASMNGGVYARWADGHAGILIDQDRPRVEQLEILEALLKHDNNLID